MLLASAPLEFPRFFTLGIEAWQYFLPSRVADVNDVIWNTSGTILGALLGHARLRVRFEFE